MRILKNKNRIYIKNNINEINNFYNIPLKQYFDSQ